jgi:hypothetical protein
MAKSGNYLNSGAGAECFLQKFDASKARPRWAPQAAATIVVVLHDVLLHDR